MRDPRGTRGEGSGRPAGGDRAPAPLSSVAVAVKDLWKVYRLYDRPADRLREAILPLGRPRHKEHHALREVSFEIRRGETVGIVGRNGSGKSTLLKLITGVTAPTRGTVFVDGKVSALLELGTGFHPELTGIENIYFGGVVVGYSREEIDRRLDAIVDFADIGQYIHQPVKTYSSGMYVRLAFALAIHTEPKLLILDEVLAVGDIAFQNKCLDVISRLAESPDTTILFVTHDLNAVRLLCDRVLFLEGGRLAMDGSPGRVIDAYTQSVLGEGVPFRTGAVTLGLADGSNVFSEEVACRGRYSLIVELRDLAIEKGLLLAFRFVNLENKFSHRLETDRFRGIRGEISYRRLVAHFDDLSLPEGHYSVNVSVSDGSFIHRVHHADDALRFRVKTPAGSPGFLRAEWREQPCRPRKIGIAGWWGGKNEGDRYILETLARAFHDGFDIHPVAIPFKADEAGLQRLNSLDFLLVGGGGLFTLTPPRPFDDFPAWRAKLTTPFSLVGVGIQEIGPDDEPVFREIADASIDFVVRDGESLEIARRFSPKVRKAPDLTFLRPRTVARREDAASIGVNLRVWNFDERRTYDNGAWCRAVNALPGPRETVPLSFLEGLEDADAMARIEGTHHPAFDMAVYGNLRVMVGMRLHSLIFAVQNGIPVIGIAYAPKVRRFFREVGLEEFCLDLDEHARLGDVYREAVRRHEEISLLLRGYTESARLAATACIEEVRRSMGCIRDAAGGRG